MHERPRKAEAIVCPEESDQQLGLRRGDRRLDRSERPLQHTDLLRVAGRVGQLAERGQLEHLVTNRTHSASLRETGDWEPGRSGCSLGQGAAAQCPSISAIS